MICWWSSTDVLLAFNIYHQEESREQILRMQFHIPGNERTEEIYPRSSSV